jgi:hypothetical protein
MNLNLGKIFLLLIIPIVSWAGEVSAKLAQTVIYKGDMASLTLTAQGNGVEFPNITDIGTYEVLGTSSRQSTTIVNGAYSKSISQTYTFAPEQSLVIPSYKVIVDGQEVLTTPLTLKVVKPSPASKDASVQLEMKVDKHRAYVGEPIKMELIFKSLPNIQYDKIELSEPNLAKFWVKKLPNLKQGSEGAYTTQTYTYVLFPQQEGNYTIEAPFAQLGTIVEQGRGFFSTRQISWNKLYANALNIEVKPLPNGLEVYGDFSISTQVDKKEVKANKPVNLTIDIKGQGNLEDIKKIDLDIPGTVIYSDDAKVYNSGITKGVFSQKVAIIADRNFTIPSVSFAFFDKETQQEKVIKTEPIDIIVKGTPSQSYVASKIEEKVLPSPVSNVDKNEQSSVVNETACSSSQTNVLWYLLGLFSGILLSVGSWFIRQKVTQNRIPKEISMVKKIKKAKDDKSLFELLLPYRDDDPFIKESLLKLEKNIYGSGSETIDKKELLEVFEDLLS